MSDDTSQSNARAAILAKDMTARLALAETSMGTRTQEESVRQIANRSELHSIAAIRPDVTQGSGHLRLAHTQVLPPDVATRWAHMDAKEFQRLSEPRLVEEAAASIATNANLSDAYRTGLSALAPDVSKRVQAVDLALAQAETVKEDRKSAELATLHLDATIRSKLSTRREQDTRDAAAALGLDTIEVTRFRERRLEPVQDSAPQLAQTKSAQQPRDNQVESDEAFTARINDKRSVVPPEVESRYRRNGNRYFEKELADSVAFEDKGNKLETRSNSVQVAESLVLIARARGWDEIKVSGSETFRKEAWLEATSLGIKVKGYTPSFQNKEELAKRAPAQANSLEKDTQPSPVRTAEAKAETASSAAAKASPDSRQAEAFIRMSPVDGAAIYPELVGAYALAAAIDKQSEAAGFSAEQRARIGARARKTIAANIDRGQYPEVQIKEQVQVQVERKHEPSQELTR